MARSVVEVDRDTRDLHDSIVDEYRAMLAQPAVLPWEGSEYTPTVVGPSWQTVGDRWLLPEKTIGWDVLGNSGVWLQHSLGVPWRFTPEQARIILWWYALDKGGRFLFRDGVLQRLKGWGKDPLGATICFNEMAGPARFAGWRSDGSPAAMDVPDAWVQTAAVSLEQTKNTMRLFPGLISNEAVLEHRLQIGKEIIHGYADERMIQAVTSSPRTLEGARSTFVLKNETHHWLSSNEGHEMADVIERNATKSPDGAARTLSITNAYDPVDDSVAQREREAWEAMAQGEYVDGGIFYDSLEAGPDAPLSAEEAPAVVASIRGDSVWLNVQRIVSSILDPRNPPSRSRRFWYNQITATEDSWLTPQLVEAAAKPDTEITSTDEIALFFDGAKSDDSTGLIGCRISDGHLITLGIWQRPPGARGEGWQVNRHEVDQRVREVLEAMNVVAFFGDPSHAKDDEDLAGFWDSIIDGWHQDHSALFRTWAVQSGPARHSVMWDMSKPSNVQQFTKAAERVASEFRDGQLTHDGHPALVRHLINARRYPNRYGVSIWKGHRESSQKVDLAVCAIGARMLRRLVLNRGDEKKTGKRPGKVW